MTKIAIVHDEVCSICEKPNTELLILEKEGFLFNTDVYICQSCVSKWFRSFDKANNKNLKKEKSGD